MTAVSCRDVQQTVNKEAKLCDATVSVSLADFDFLKWNTVWFGRCILTFCKNLLSPTSE
jgi:hypothetical protein